MPVSMAYATVIAIWATTPLAIKLSNDSLAPMASASLRFLLAAALALLICQLLKRGPFIQLRHWKLYTTSALGIFPNMPLVYLAVQYIPSGLIAVLFGMTPFITGLLAKPLLGESLLSREKLLALSLSCLGLVVVFREQLAVNEDAGTGLALMALAMLVFPLSNVLVRRVSQQMNEAGEAIDNFQQVCGSILFALPGLLLCWLFAADEGLPVFSSTSLWSLVYLSVVSSLIGFVAYFRVLTTMSMGLVSLLPMMTPVLAMFIGAMVAGERLSPTAMVGCVLILLGLGWYQGLFRFLRRRLTQRGSQ